MKQTLSWNGLGLELEGPGPYAGLAHSRSKILLGTILALIWPKPANIFRALCGFTIMYWNAMKIFSLLGRTNFFLLYPVSVEEQSPMKLKARKLMPVSALSKSRGKQVFFPNHRRPSKTCSWSLRLPAASTSISLQSIQFFSQTFIDPSESVSSIHLSIFRFFKKHMVMKIWTNNEIILASDQSLCNQWTIFIEAIQG